MTTQELIDYYTNLLIIQYRDKPKARGTVAASVKMMVMDNLPVDVQNAFDIETAVGVQLDVLGKYQNVQRRTTDFDGNVVLDDDDFRQLIKIATIRNTFGSSLYEIQTLLHQNFPGGIIAFDFANMQMGYLFNSSVGSLSLAEVFVRNGYLPKPMGVQLASLIYVPDIDNLFGMQTYESQAYMNHGFNTYENYDEDAPWVRYENAIFA